MAEMARETSVSPRMMHMNGAMRCLPLAMKSLWTKALIDHPSPTRKGLESRNSPRPKAVISRAEY
jgi:hypothetical protein